MKNPIPYVLASALEGVIHDAARQGALRSRSLRNELKALVLSYVSPGKREPHA
jgi:hypothetical protein